MNAQQRRRDKRERQIFEAGRRAALLQEEADRKVMHLEVANRALSESLSRTSAELGKAREHTAIVEAGGQEAERELEEAAREIGRLKLIAERAENAERRVRQLEAEDMDASRLRRRLKAKTEELEAAHRRIHELEAQVRTEQRSGVLLAGTAESNAELRNLLLAGRR